CLGIGVAIVLGGQRSSATPTRLSAIPVGKGVGARSDGRATSSSPGDSAGTTAHVSKSGGEPATRGGPLQSRLADLRRRLRLVVTLRGGCWVLAALVGSVTLACLIDQAVHVGLRRDLPGMIRAVFLVGILAGTGF